MWRIDVPTPGCVANTIQAMTLVSNIHEPPPLDERIFGGESTTRKRNLSVSAGFDDRQRS